jgi:hypothetical protein
MRVVKGLPAARQQQQQLQHQQQQQAARSISSRSVRMAQLHPLFHQERSTKPPAAAHGAGAPQQLSTTDEAQQHDLSSVTAPAAAAAAVSTSQCPFAHQAGLSALASAASNMVNSMRQQPTSSPTASGSTTQQQHQQQQLSGHGWSVVGPESAAVLAAVPGRWCWNPLLGEMLQLEAQGAGAFLLQRYRWVRGQACW